MFLNPLLWVYQNVFDITVNMEDEYGTEKYQNHITIIVDCTIFRDLKKCIQSDNTMMHVAGCWSRVGPKPRFCDALALVYLPFSGHYLIY